MVGGGVSCVCVSLLVYIELEDYLWHKNNTWGLCIGIELCTVRIREVHNMTRKVYNSKLHAKAYAKIGDIVFTGILSSHRFPLNASVSKATGH